MKSINNIISESQIICESLNERRIINFVKHLKTLGIKFSNIISAVTSLERIKWDRIDGSCVTEYSADDANVFKKTVYNGSDIAIIFKDDYYLGIASGDVYIRFYKYNDTEQPICKSDSYYAKNGYEYIRTRTAKDAASTTLNNATGFYLIHITDDLQANTLVWKRYNDKNGVVENTPEYYEALARANVERYKKLAAQIRINKDDSEYKKIDDLVANTIARAMTTVAKFRANPEKWTGKNYTISLLIEKIKKDVVYNYGKNYGYNGLLSLYNKYIGLVSDLKTASGYSSEETTKKNIKDVADNIIKMCKSIDEIIEEFA